MENTTMGKVLVLKQANAAGLSRRRGARSIGETAARGPHRIDLWLLHECGTGAVRGLSNGATRADELATLVRHDRVSLRSQSTAAMTNRFQHAEQDRL